MNIYLLFHFSSKYGVEYLNINSWYAHIDGCKFVSGPNSIFYKEGYDPQSLIDELNNTLVNTIELEELLTKSALIIQENLKTSFCTFYIRDTSYFKERIIGAHRKDPEIDEIDKDPRRRLMYIAKIK